MINKIEIRGARVHNLKNIDLTIPRDKLVVLTGLSGSGKSSLALIRYTQRGTEDSLNPCLPMQECSSVNWINRTLTL